MISEYRNNECCRLVKEYESMVQGELFEDVDGRGNAGAYLESLDYPFKFQRRWVTGEELESIRKEIRERKGKELLSQCYWYEDIHYDEEDGKFYVHLNSFSESFSERFQYLKKDVDYGEFYSVSEIVDFLESDGGGRMMLISSLGDYELDVVVDTAFSMLSDDELEKTIDICCSDYTTVPELLIQFRELHEEGYRYVALYGIGNLRGLSRYGEQILDYIEDLGLVVVAYGGSSYAISVAVKETLKDRVKLMVNPFRYLWRFRAGCNERIQKDHDLHHYMTYSPDDGYDDWIGIVASDMHRGFEVSRHPETRRFPDGVELESQIRSVLRSCSLDYIEQCFWDEMDYGARFWYKTPNRWLRKEAVDAMAELKRVDLYPYMGNEDRKIIRDALMDMGILFRVDCHHLHYLTPIPWLMGIFNHEFETVFQRAFMEEGYCRPVSARRKSLGFAFRFSARYWKDLCNLENAEDTVIGRRIGWIYEEDYREREEMEMDRELKCVERHGWSILGLERP